MKRTHGRGLHRKAQLPTVPVIDKQSLISSLLRPDPSDPSRPQKKSSIMHVLDRRIDFDKVPEDAGGYELARCWIRDDPWRGRKEVRDGELRQCHSRH